MTVVLGSIDPVLRSAEIVKSRTLKLRALDQQQQQQQHVSHPSSVLYTHELNRTVVIMPFLLSDMGAGHSNLLNRMAYLNACFWSIYAYMPHIVVAVKSQRDYDYVAQETKLPFYDIILCTFL